MNRRRCYLPPFCLSLSRLHTHTQPSAMHPELGWDFAADAHPSQPFCLRCGARRAVFFGPHTTRALLGIWKGGCARRTCTEHTRCTHTKNSTQALPQRPQHSYSPLTPTPTHLHVHHAHKPTWARCSLAPRTATQHALKTRNRHYLLAFDAHTTKTVGT